MTHIVMANKYGIAFLLTCVLNAWLSHGAGEHAYQQFFGCAFNSHGQIGHFWRYGYNGKDVMHIDLTKEAMVSSGETGQFLAEERKDLEYVKKKEKRLMKVCTAVQTVFSLSNNSFSRAVRPKVHLRMTGEGDQKFLMCLVHGFYPNVIRVKWAHKGKPIYYGTSTTGILPHKDGTFQMTNYLSLRNTSGYGIACEIEHISVEGKMSVTQEETPIHSLWSVVVAVFFAGLALPVATTTLIIWFKKREKKSTGTEATDSSTSYQSEEVPPSVSLIETNACSHTVTEQ